ncbi:MAG: MotA/TolQ/ExbB proton channel family protein [Cellvibrionaceae bacterium]|nr:MotA/TolQ/ExbB proton channel family protein [Cellvibrionaceae bacterium]MCV6628085.1 MotA/TolQ/ExbB proton channel family protein [Cellvibrionaceae bacterium]
MRRNGYDFIFQVFALIIATIVVHAVFVTVIRPNADAILQAQAALQASGQAFVAERSIYVVLRDYEQEACFILMLWALAIMGLKAWQTKQERSFLQLDLLNIAEGSQIYSNDTARLAEPLQQLPPLQQSYLLPRALLQALRRFGSSHTMGDAASAIKESCDTESDRLDSELAMVRYIAWAIPSIGFIGTVRGIGEALSQAHKAVEGDIVGVTVSLGVAFNSTFIALVISIVIMFFTHQLQLMQERLVLDTQDYCDTHLLRHLNVGSPTEQ